VSELNKDITRDLAVESWELCEVLGTCETQHLSIDTRWNENWEVILKAQNFSAL